MEIGIATFAWNEGFCKSVRPATKSFVKYCARHGYQLFDTVPEEVRNSRAVSWWRVPFLSYLLREHPNLDVVVWFDADVLITNHTISLETVLKEYSLKKHMIFSLDIMPSKVNSGVFFVRNTPWARLFLGLWDSQSDLVLAGLGIQKVLNFLILGNVGDCLSQLEIEPDTTRFNQMHSWKPEYFANHIAGYRGKSRRVRLEKLAAMIIE